jgi:uncharacterized protein
VLFIAGSQIHSTEFGQDAHARAAKRRGGYVDLYDRVNLIPFGRLFTAAFEGSIGK